jgi:hypothetical protein
MKRSRDAVAPARSDGLVVERLNRELLIYDLDHDEVHHLDSTCAAVFELCDGHTTPDQLAARTAEQLGQPLSTDTVHEALEQLAAKHLLDQPQTSAGVSRREAVRKAALIGAGAAAAAPVIKSVVAPTPAQAQSEGSCVPQGGACTQGTTKCCADTCPANCEGACDNTGHCGCIC